MVDAGTNSTKLPVSLVTAPDGVGADFHGFTKGAEHGVPSMTTEELVWLDSPKDRLKSLLKLSKRVERLFSAKLKNMLRKPKTQRSSRNF